MFAAALGACWRLVFADRQPAYSRVSSIPATGQREDHRGGRGRRGGRCTINSDSKEYRRKGGARVTLGNAKAIPAFACSIGEHAHSNLPDPRQRISSAYFAYARSGFRGAISRCSFINAGGEHPWTNWCADAKAWQANYD